MDRVTLQGIDSGGSMKRGVQVIVWKHDMFEQVREHLQAPDRYAVVDPSSRPGDILLLYVGRPVSAVVAVLQQTTFPAPSEPHWSARSDGIWRNTAGTRFIGELDQPLPYGQLRRDFPELASSKGNFQGSAFTEDPERAKPLLELISHQVPDLFDRAEDVPLVDVPAFATESELGDWVLAHLSELSELVETPLRPASVDLDDVDCREHVLSGSDTRPDLILVSEETGQWFVVELKNTRARPHDVGQLASYVVLARQRYWRGLSAKGLLITLGNTVASSAAERATPCVTSLSVAEIAAQATYPDLGDLQLDQLSSSSGTFHELVSELRWLLECHWNTVPDDEFDDLLARAQTLESLISLMAQSTMLGVRMAMGDDSDTTGDGE